MTPVQEKPHGGTRWRRFALLLVPSLALTGGFGAAVSGGVLAASVEYQSGDATVSSRSIYGIDGALVISELDRALVGKQRVLRAAVGQAVINEVCLSEPVLGGAFTIKVTAGDGDPNTWEIKANSAVVDVTQGGGSIKGDGIVTLGMDATTVESGPHELGPRVKDLGVEAGFLEARSFVGKAAVMRLTGNMEAPRLRFEILPGSGASVQCQKMTAPTVVPPRAGWISGSARDANGAGIQGVRVTAFNAFGALNSVVTDAAGNYTLYAFQRDDLVLRFEHRRHALRWNGGGATQQTATPVKVTANQASTGVNVTMPICPSPSPC